MQGNSIILSTAYFPPAGYFALLANSGEALIENHETYLKQSFRNRCVIAGANGNQTLTVPVLKGSSHKVPISEIGIDYSRRWIKIHLRAIESAYSNSPFFSFYSDRLFAILEKKHSLLTELNMELLKELMSILNISTPVQYTSSFTRPGNTVSDFRYSISPKRSDRYQDRIIMTPYLQVFSDRYGFTPDLSIIDLLFNLGPEANRWLTMACK